MLNDKIAIVTGAGQGLGRGIVCEMARQRAAFVGQCLGETSVGRLCERRSINECRKQGTDRHSVIIREGGCSCYGFACSRANRSRPTGATATW